MGDWLSVSTVKFNILYVTVTQQGGETDFICSSHQIETSYSKIKDHSCTPFLRRVCGAGKGANRLLPMFVSVTGFQWQRRMMQALRARLNGVQATLNFETWSEHEYPQFSSRKVSRHCISLLLL